MPPNFFLERASAPSSHRARGRPSIGGMPAPVSDSAAEPHAMLNWRRRQKLSRAYLWSPVEVAQPGCAAPAIRPFEPALQHGPRAPRRRVDCCSRYRQAAVYFRRFLRQAMKWAARSGGGGGPPALWVAALVRASTPLTGIEESAPRASGGAVEVTCAAQAAPRSCMWLCAHTTLLQIHYDDVMGALQSHHGLGRRHDRSNGNAA